MFTPTYFKQIICFHFSSFFACFCFYVRSFRFHVGLDYLNGIILLFTAIIVVYIILLFTSIYILFVDVSFLEQLATAEGCTRILVCLAVALRWRREFVIACAPPAVEVPLGAPPCVGLVGVGEE